MFYVASHPFGCRSNDVSYGGPHARDAEEEVTRVALAMAWQPVRAVQFLKGGFGLATIKTQVWLGLAWAGLGWAV